MLHGWHLIDLINTTTEELGHFLETFPGPKKDIPMN